MNQQFAKFIIGSAHNNKKYLQSLIAIFLSVMILALFLMFYFAREGVALLDSVDQENDKLVMASLLDDRKNIMERLIHDYAEWSDAFRNLHEKPNKVFADENITNTLVTNYGMKNAIIARFDKSIWLYYENGKNVSPPPILDSNIEHFLDLLIADYHASNGQPQKFSRTGFVDIDRHLYMVSANFIAALNDETGKTEPLVEHPSIMIFVREINETTLKSWADIYKIHGVKYMSESPDSDKNDQEMPHSNGRFSIPINNVDNHKIGEISWMPNLSSTLIVGKVAPKLAGILLALIALAACFAVYVRGALNAQQKISNEIDASRQFMQTLFDTDPTLIQVRDKDGVIFFCNQASASHFGKTPDEMIGKSFQSIVMDPNFAESTAQDDSKVISFGNDHQKQDITYDINGQLCVFQTVRRKITALDGMPMVLAASTDITKQKLAMDELESSRSRAEQASKAKTEFLATISHEIRTPMNGILGFSQLLSDTPLTTDQKEYISIIQNSSKSLLAVINDILDMSRIEAGRLMLENITLNPNDIVDTAIALSMPAAKEKNLSLIKEQVGGPLPLIMGDPARISQILSNLISNAVKFTEKGGIHVRTETLTTTRKQAKIKIEVIDTGIGMSPDLKNQIFQKFTQGDSSKSRKFGGMGLGLTIAKELIEMMGGEIGIDSTPGKGSNFWFTLNLNIAAGQ